MDPFKQQSKAPCKFHASGMWCKFGKQCRFSHQMTKLPGTPSSRHPVCFGAPDKVESATEQAQQVVELLKDQDSSLEDNLSDAFAHKYGTDLILPEKCSSVKQYLLSINLLQDDMIWTIELTMNKNKQRVYRAHPSVAFGNRGGGDGHSAILIDAANVGHFQRTQPNDPTFFSWQHLEVVFKTYLQAGYVKEDVCAVITVSTLRYHPMPAEFPYKHQVKVVDGSKGSDDYLLINWAYDEFVYGNKPVKIVTNDAFKNWEDHLEPEVASFLLNNKEKMLVKYVVLQGPVVRAESLSVAEAP